MIMLMIVIDFRNPRLGIPHSQKLARLMMALSCVVVVFVMWSLTKLKVYVVVFVVARWLFALL